VHTLTFLSRRYQEILPSIPDDTRRYRSFPDREILTWLRDEICPVLHEFANRAQFRNAAKWSIHALARGADTDERRAVDAAESAIVNCALSYLRICRKRAVVTALRSCIPSERDIVHEAVIVGGKNVQTIESTVDSVDGYVNLISQLNRITSRFWTDLVSADDFFSSVAGWNNCQQSAAAGEFIERLNPELPAGTPMIARCLLRRVELLGEMLNHAQKFLKRAIRTLGPRLSKVSEEVSQLWQAVTQSQTTLRQACLDSREQPLRDACALLAQVYCTFADDPDIAWLGLREEAVSHGRSWFRSRLCVERNIRLLDNIAKALETLKTFSTSSRFSEFDDAVASGGLVLRQTPPELYWESKKYKSKRPTPRLWKLLSILVKHAQRGQSIDNHDIYDRSTAVGKTALPNLVCRLKPSLPPSLRKKLVPGETPETYRFAIPQEHIFVFV
jgi:hypothetical protein